jgi:fermentation-respiration switch protein FrsA (DUF1100 family)
LPRKLVFVGWAEGAGLGVLALVPPANKQIYLGLAAVGLTEQASLAGSGPGRRGLLTRRPPPEPAFATGPFLPELPPTPFLMVQSTGDENTPVDTARRLFEDAREPKMLRFVNAGDPRFEGNHTGLLDALREGLAWMVDKSR